MKKIILSAACIAVSFGAFAQEMLAPVTTVENPTIINHRDACNQEVASTSIENGGFLGGESNQRLAIDIPVDDNTAFAIETITLAATDDGTTFTLTFMEDDGGLPGAVIATVTDPAIVNQTNYGSNFGFEWDFYELDLSGEGVVLEGETLTTYWMEVESDATAWESTVEAFIGSPGAFANDNTTGDWTIGQSEYVYNIEGDCSPLSTNAHLLAEVAVFPNPTVDVVNVTVPNSVEVTGAALYDILGKDTGVALVNGTMNVANLPQGIYMLSLETTAGSLTRKIVRK